MQTSLFIFDRVVPLLVLLVYATDARDLAYLRVDPLGNPTGTAFAGRLWHGGLPNGTQAKTDRRCPRDHGIGEVINARAVHMSGERS